MSRPYRQLRWLAVLFTIAAAVAVVIAILVAAFDFNIHWTNQDWSAAGTIVGAAMTLAAVSVALSQNRQIQENAAQEQSEARGREESAAVEGIARIAAAFSTRMDAIAEEFLQQEIYNKLNTRAHARQYGPEAPATVDEIRTSFAESQRIIQRRQEAVQAGLEAQTAIALAILRISTPTLQEQANAVLGMVTATSQCLDAPGGRTDWEGVQLRAPLVRQQVALLLRDFAALQGVAFQVEVEPVQGAPAENE